MQQQNSAEKKPKIIPEKMPEKKAENPTKKPARKTGENTPEKKAEKPTRKTAAKQPAKAAAKGETAPAKTPEKTPAKAPAKAAPRKAKKLPAPAANELVLSHHEKEGEQEGEHITTTCITGSAQILVSTTDDNPAEASHYTADWKQDKLIEQIRKFEQELDDDTEIAIRLASFGSTITMKVEYIGYQNPDVLYFYGTVGGERAQLIQNMNQLNFLLSAEKKEEKHLPPRRIGFLHEHQAEHAEKAGDEAVR